MFFNEDGATDDVSEVQAPATDDGAVDTEETHEEAAPEATPEM